MALSAAERSAKLNEFTLWVRTHLKGDEKGEAQIFLDRLFRAFGWPGLKEAGASCEERVRNTHGGTSFADLVWKPIVVIEMKRRGSDLAKYYSQAFAYWTRLVPKRPRYAVLCNFDELWIYDFDTQLDEPVDRVLVQDLPLRYAPLNFLWPGDETPLFGNHQEAVTRGAADKLAACFNSLVSRRISRGEAQRFTLQMLMALFAEDIGLLDRYRVTELIEGCRTPSDSYDLLGGLFTAMNTPQGVPGGRFQGVAYFNGGLFAQPATLELESNELRLLRDAAQFDWSTVRPEIFGTLFEHSLGKAARHATGAHFTNPVDIMKVVGPTIVAPWSEAVESADTLGRLRELLARLATFTVLDPACGSGNFLYVAFRELKRIESRIYERMATEYRSVDERQRPFGVVTGDNFYGIDVNPFAIDIAKVTMALAKKLSIDEFHTSERTLPLDNLDNNFKAMDALVGPSGARTPWFKSDVIIGNPPFLDARKMTMELGREYVRRVAEAYPEVPRRADHCTYWFHRAHLELKACTPEDPFAGRAGLVGTQNVRNNNSRQGGLDLIAATGTIVEAVDNQPWSGEANVHVSIVNWINSQDSAVVPRVKRLWFRVPGKPGPRSRRPRGAAATLKRYELDTREVQHLNSALRDGVDVSAAQRLACNLDPKRCFEGIQPGHEGFRLSASEFESTIPAADRGTVVFPYLAGTELLTSTHEAPGEYLIDFGTLDLLDARVHEVPFAIVQERVLPKWAANAEAERQETGRESGEHQSRLRTWWQLKRRRTDLLQAIAPLARFVVCSRVTKRPIFAFVSTARRPDSSLSCFAFEDDYSFGVLQSSVHAAWFVAQGSKLTERLRYTPDSVFDTFPWPQHPATARIEAVAVAAVTLRRVRARGMAGRAGGLRSLYRSLDLPGEHPLKTAQLTLDEAVLAAYGFEPRRDVLEQLMDLNSAVARRIGSAEPVTSPGIPAAFPHPERLVSADFLGSATVGLL